MSTIRNLRTRAGFSLREAAARCAVSTTALSGVETQARPMPLKAATIERICAALGATQAETLDALFEARKLPVAVEAAIFRDRATFGRVVKAAR